MANYTSSLGLELITPGSQAGLWGNTTNNSLNLLDQAITGVTPYSGFAGVTGATWVPTDYNGAQDEARAAVFNFTGTATGPNTVEIPNKQKTYFVRNGTGQDIVFKTSVGTTPCTVGAGYNLPVFCDGNNNVYLAILAPGAGTLTVTGGGTGVTNFGSGGFIKSSGGTSALTSASKVNAATELTGAVPVANGGTGAVSLTSGALLIGNGTGTVAALSGGVAGYVATWNGSTWVASAPTSGGVTNVTALSPLNSSGGSTPQISLTGLVPTANGGTGASSLTGAGIVTTGDAQSISGGKTFNGTTTFNSTVNFNGITTSQAWNMTSTTSMYYLPADQNIKWAINSGVKMQLGPAGNFEISGNQAYKVGGGTWTDSSDARLKENVTPLTGALSKIAALKPVAYKWKYSRPDATNVGFIAQDVEPLFPLAVSETDPTDEQKPYIPEGSKVKNIGWQNDMIAYLVGAIKELKAEVDALKAAK